MTTERCTSCRDKFDDTAIGRRSMRDPSVCVSCDDTAITVACDAEQRAYAAAENAQAARLFAKDDVIEGVAFNSGRVIVAVEDGTPVIDRAAMTEADWLDVITGRRSITEFEVAR